HRDALAQVRVERRTRRVIVADGTRGGGGPDRGGEAAVDAAEQLEVRGGEDALVATLPPGAHGGLLLDGRHEPPEKRPRLQGSALPRRSSCRCGRRGGRTGESGWRLDDHLLLSSSTAPGPVPPIVNEGVTSRCRP